MYLIIFQLVYLSNKIKISKVAYTIIGYFSKFKNINNNIFETIKISMAFS